MANWPANGEEDWNTKMLANLAVSHETNGTLNSAALQQAGKFQQTIAAGGTVVFTDTLTAAATFETLATGLDTFALCYFEVTASAASTFYMGTPGLGTATTTNHLFPKLVSTGTFQIGFFVCVSDASGDVRIASTDNTTTFTIKLIGHIK